MKKRISYAGLVASFIAVSIVVIIIFNGCIKLKQYKSKGSHSQASDVYYHADNIKSIVGWDQDKFLQVHLLFLIYEYLQILTSAPNKRDHTLIDIITRELVTTANAYLILS